MKRELAQKLLRILQRATQPLGIDELCQAFGSTASRRSILRRLEGLIAEGEVIRIGNARATCYEIASSRVAEPGVGTTLPTPAPQPKSEVGESPPAGQGTSLQGLRDQVRQPQALRRPAVYRPEFLAGYSPNSTAYLPNPLRQHLHAIGQSQHMAEMPAGTYARQVLSRLIIDLSWNSSRLEGSTYSLLETEHLLAKGRLEDLDRVQETQMILNHKSAIEFLVEAPGALAFDRYTVLNLHAILTDGLLKNPSAEGALRTVPVGISGTVFHPTQDQVLIGTCFDEILQKAAVIEDPFECAFFLMVQLPYLQPFEDGNKRTSRLLANLPLIQRNIAPLSFTGVPLREYTEGVIAVYEMNRVELLREVFVAAFEKSAGRYATIRQEIGEPDPLQVRYRLEIKEQVREVVVRRLPKRAAAAYLRDWARREVTTRDQAGLIELIEERLLGLNEGNLARVRVRPIEFAEWQPLWD